jgi:hypothetical protein
MGAVITVILNALDQQDDLDWKQSHWGLAGFYFPQSPDPDWPGSHIWLRSTAHCELVLETPPVGEKA